MSDNKLDGNVLVDVVTTAIALNCKNAENRAAKKTNFAYGRKHGVRPKAVRRLIRYLETPEECELDDEELKTYRRLFESSSRSDAPVRARGASETKDLDDAAPPDQPRTKPLPNVVNGAAVGGDAELLDIPPSLRRAANGEAPAPETKDQQNDDGEPDPFDWPGEITPEAATPETVK